MWAIIGIIFIAGYIFHYLASAIKETHFYCGSSAFGRFLSSRCTVLRERYWPNPFIANAHLMTRFCTIFRSKLKKLTFCREIIPTPDKGQISIDWYAPDRSSSDEQFTAKNVGARPVALFLPGIAGTSSAEYLRTLVPLAYGVGYQPVVLNYRGLTSTELLTPRLYCALNFDDLETTLKHIKKEAAKPDVKIIATALSMGGIILAGYLTTRESESLIDAAFMASVIWDAEAGARNIESGFWNRDINKMMTKSLIKIVQRHRSWFEHDPKYDLKAVENCKTLRAFDHAFTIRMFDKYGFKTAEQYYSACTYKDKVHLIKVPTLVLQAADDMMANEKDLPTAQVTKSSHIAMVVTPKGGHLGFMDAAKSNGQSTYYLERLFVQYMVALNNLEDGCDSPRDIIPSQA